MKLKDKVAIITGAGQGIGEAYAHRFAQEGAKVVVADINQEKGRAVAAAIGGDAVFERVDVSNEEDTKRIAKAVADRFGRIDILINNAAIFYGIENFNSTFEYLRKIFDVNYFGAWLMCRAVFPYMEKQNSGVVINQSSSAAYLPEHADARRPAVVPLQRDQSGDQRDDPLHGRFRRRVRHPRQRHLPGPTLTEATTQGVPRDPRHDHQQMMAIKRPLEPDDLTGTAVWLASDDAKMVTGQVITVDGDGHARMNC
jgi:3-oxoacyl-[acyl-carrier protein] reductase